MIIDILIPARNEAEALKAFLPELTPLPVRQIVLVDNGSVDQTADIAHRHRCQVVHHPVPGYGGACLAGIRYLAEDPPDVLVFMDADRSDDPNDFRAITTPILDKTHQMVIGSRILGQCEPGSLTPQQRFGNWLATRLIRFFWNVKFTDLGPFRAITWKALQELKMRDQNFGWTVEMQIKAAQKKMNVTEVPVRYRRRIGQSKISGTVSGVVKAGTKILWTIFWAAWRKTP